MNFGVLRYSGRREVTANGGIEFTQRNLKKLEKVLDK